MSTSAALDPGFVLWSIPEPEWPGRPLIVLLRGWSQNPDQLLCPQVARPPLKNQGGRHEVHPVQRGVPRMNHEVPVYQRHDNEPLPRNSAPTNRHDSDRNTTSTMSAGESVTAHDSTLPAAPAITPK